ALAAADLGIAVGDANDLARSAAAVGLLESGVQPVANALLLTARAGRILRQNLVWALAYNGLILPAAVVGYVHPLFAAVAMAASSVTVSLNALRAGWLPRRLQVTSSADNHYRSATIAAALEEHDGHGSSLTGVTQWPTNIVKITFAN